MAWKRINGPSVLTLKCSATEAGVTSRTLRKFWAIPALAMTTSRPPEMFLMVFAAAWTSVGEVDSSCKMWMFG